jgi:hypothetical protein
LVINVGSNEWNCQVRDLAQAVAAVMPGVEVSIGKNAQPDKRSYRVNYDMFKECAPNHQPLADLRSTILELKEGLEAAGFMNPAYRDSPFMRLNVLKTFRDAGLLTDGLDWTFAARKEAVAH